MFISLKLKHALLCMHCSHSYERTSHLFESPIFRDIGMLLPAIPKSLNHFTQDSGTAPDDPYLYKDGTQLPRVDS